MAVPTNTQIIKPAPTPIPKPGPPDVSNVKKTSSQAPTSAVVPVAVSPKVAIPVVKTMNTAAIQNIVGSDSAERVKSSNPASRSTSERAILPSNINEQRTMNAATEDFSNAVVKSVNPSSLPSTPSTELPVAVVSSPITVKTMNTTAIHNIVGSDSAERRIGR